MGTETPGFGYYLTGWPQVGNAVNQGLQGVLNSAPMRAGTGAAKGLFDLVNPVPNLQEAYRISSEQGYSGLLDKDYWYNFGMAGLSAIPGVRAGGAAARGVVTKNPQLVQQAGKTLSDWYGGTFGKVFGGIAAAAGAITGVTNQNQAPTTPPAGTTPGQYDWVKSIPTSAMIRSWEQTNAAGQLMGLNNYTPSLSPSEIEYFAAQQRELRRRAGQAAASDKLQTQQQKQEANRQITDLRSFMLTAPQDVATATTALGPAAELGFQRSVERDTGEKIGDVRQSLADYLARQKLASSQRGSNVSAGMTDIELAKAAALTEKQLTPAELLAAAIYGGK